jgi:hypothetical protein
MQNNCETKLTNFMELGPSWEAASCAATQELPSILWTPAVHCHVLQEPSTGPILSQINPVHTTPNYLRSILILYTHLSLGLPSGPFPSRFPTNILYAFHVYLIRATCRAPLILDLIFSLGRLSKEFVQVRGPGTFHNKLILYREEAGGSPPCQLSTTAYSIYSQLPSISGCHLLHLQQEDVPYHGDKGK